MRTLIAALAGLWLASGSLLWAKPSWRTVTIPHLPAGASLGQVWSGFAGDVYVWARTDGGSSGDVPTAHLLHWDGTRWRLDLKLPGYAPAGLFGTDARNVFAGVNKCEAGVAAGCGPGRGARVFRSMDGGRTWVPQALPPEAEGRTLGRLDGTFENVHGVLEGAGIIRFDGRGWSKVFEGGGAADGALAVSFQSANEGYMAGQRGWGRWVDGVWKFMPAEFGFREVRGLWGLRDRAGQLRLYAADDGRFSDGIRVWRFSPSLEDFETVMEESSSDEAGSANGLWGSAEDDIYAIGHIGDGRRAGTGRVHRFDGTAWRREKSLEPIPAPAGIHGTSRNDVWISLADGRLLHYSTAAAVSRKMAESASSRQP